MRRFCFVLYLMVINLGVTRVFHLNHRDVRVDENSPQRSHDFFKTGECLQGSCSSGKGFIYAEPPLCHLKDHNFSAPERFYRPLNLTAVVESNQKKNAF